MEHLPDNTERSLITGRYGKLLRASSGFLNKKNLPLVREAFTIMLDKHGRKLHDNREPYFCHAVDVACIVAGEMKLGLVSTLAALLNGLTEKEKQVSDFCKSNKSLEIAAILAGLDRIKDLRTDKLHGNADNFISLLLSVSGDVRTVLIQLAGRLQYMRNIESLPQPMQMSISGETAGLYAPLAHRLGLYKIKMELDELSLHYSNPDVYNFLSAGIREAESASRHFFRQFLEPLEAGLSRMGLNYSIKQRTKAVSSVYAKMLKQNIDFSEVYDLFAIRIILFSRPADEKADCWKAYSVVTNIYTPETSRLRDWITIPRPNGYESLHITVRGPSGRWVEVQIRTERMDSEAELGNAAHWRYKGQKGAVETSEWLNSVRKILENPEVSENALQNEKQLQGAAGQIYVFTPEGDLRKLQAESTVLDFAFDVHTSLGATCTGGKVNGKIVPIRHTLKSGDMVEIITSRNQTPNRDWLGWVTTNRAKTKIRRYLKEAEYRQAETGKDIFRRKMSQLKISNQDEVINKMIAHFKLSGPLDLFQQLAENRIEPSHIKDVAFGTLKDSKETEEKPDSKVPKNEPLHPDRTSENVIIVNESSEIEGYKLARCCNPVMGDEIFGFITVSDGIKIHRVNCPNAARMKARYPYRTMEARWTKPAEGTYFLVTIRVSGFDQLGILSSITNMISNELKMDVRSISLDSKGGKFDGIVKVSIRDKKHLEFLLKKLLTIKGIIKASRISSAN